MGREFRRRGRVGEFVNVSLVQDRILISSDGGRVCRPLIICDRGVPRVKPGHLLALKRKEMDFPAFVRVSPTGSCRCNCSGAHWHFVM